MARATTKSTTGENKDIPADAGVKKTLARKAPVEKAAAPIQKTVKPAAKKAVAATKTAATKTAAAAKAAPKKGAAASKSMVADIKKPVVADKKK